MAVAWVQMCILRGDNILIRSSSHFRRGVKSERLIFDMLAEKGLQNKSHYWVITFRGFLDC